MAIDKAVDSAALEANLTTIANAIREKAGTSEALAFPAGFAEAIAAIQSGGEVAGTSMYATGYFVLAEDCTSTYTITSESEVLAPLFEDGVSYVDTGVKSFMALWAEPKDVSADLSNYTNSVLFFVSLPYIKRTGESTTKAVSTMKSSGQQTLTNTSDFASSMRVESASSATFAFTSTRIGYAGTKYNWLIVRCW